MAWCYTFGVGVGDRECAAPMLVVSGQSRCRCEDCGTECEGLFPGCHTLVFAPGGRELQLRALPSRRARAERDFSLSPVSGNGRPDAPERKVSEPPRRESEIEERLGRIEERIASLEKLIEEQARTAGFLRWRRH